VGEEELCVFVRCLVKELRLLELSDTSLGEEVRKFGFNPPSCLMVFIVCAENTADYLKFLAFKCLYLTTLRAFEDESDFYQ